MALERFAIATDRANPPRIETMSPGAAASSARFTLMTP
jgi:hypothetical protein